MYLFRQCRLKCIGCRRSLPENTAFHSPLPHPCTGFPDLPPPPIGHLLSMTLDTATQTSLLCPILSQSPLPAVPSTRLPPTAKELLPPGVSSCVVPGIYIFTVFFYDEFFSDDIRIIQCIGSKAGV